MADAVILAGAVAKGALTAGALRVLTDPAVKARRNIDIRRVVAASSGAINGAFLAAHLRDGSESAAMALLEELWLECGDFQDVFDVSLRALVQGRGLSTSRKVRALLERFIEARGGSRPVDLALVVTNTAGDVDVVGRAPITTFEHCVRFTGEVFDAPERLGALFDAVVASAAFPLVFEPATIQIGSRRVACVDGGVCNNSPVKYALDGDPEVDRLFVITPYPAVLESPPNLRGTALLSHLGEMLVQERLFRDLREADEVNRGLNALERAVPLRSLRERALGALGWAGRRIIEIVEIRPPSALEGDAFAAFFARRLREDYVSAGRAAARSALEAA
jgi:predicted acylesterase/phospholipase RssA